MEVHFTYERTDGYCVPAVLNPDMRLDLRDPDKPVASLALSILASNVAVGGHVYRQQPDPSGTSTVWVTDPEPRTPLQFVLWKPGAAGSAVAYLGTEQVAGQTARHYRVFDPASYAGPTAPQSSATGASALPTPCRIGAPTSGATPGVPGPSTGGTAGIGDHDDFWLAEDGTPLRIASVLGELRLTSDEVTYGKDLRVDVPDVSKAITAEEYAKRTPTVGPTSS